MPTPATALAEQDDLTQSVGLCGVSVTATCKQCDGAEARKARGARRRLLWRVAGLRLPAPRPTSPARAQVRAASGATRSQRASPVPLVQRVRPSRSLLVEGSGWLPQRVPHLARCDRSESITTRAAGSGAARSSPPPPLAAAGGRHTCVPPPALCIRSERRAARDAVVSASHI
jgi:hypothetical protein